MSAMPPLATQAVPRNEPSRCAICVINAKQQISTGLRGYLGLWSAGGTPGQAHREHRAFAQLTRHRHVAAHHACELAREGKAEPSAAEAVRGCGIGLAELLEQLGLLLRGHTDAGVGDGELDEAGAIAHPACRKLDLARFGELAGIAEEVEQYLPQPHGVHGQCAKVLLGVNDEAVLVLLGQLSGVTDDLVDQPSQLAVLVLNLVEQPHVLDGNYRLVGESRDKLDFLLRKRPHYGPRQSNNANWVSLSQERHTKHGAKGVKFDKFGHGVFRIALSVWNVNYLALEHGSAAESTRPSNTLRVT